MNLVALRMLVGDRAKYLGIVTGLTLAALLITQQGAIFTGLTISTYSYITDTGQPDIWVMDPEVEFVEDAKRMLDAELYRVRSVEGVDWAVPLYRGLLNARLHGGQLRAVRIIGLDDATLAGGPPEVIEGKLEDLRRRDAIIVDAEEAKGKLARRPAEPGGKPIPLKVGDILEINERRATVVGLCRVSRSLFWQPVIYTTYSRALLFAPAERRPLTYVLVKARSGQNIFELRDRIKTKTGLAAYAADEFKALTARYVLKQTGILVNFGIAVALGFVVGLAIAGQTFYNFTLENLRHFGTLKAMGAPNSTLLRMVLLQAVVVGGVGYGLGVGAAALFGYLLRGSELAFRLPWQLLVVSAAAIALICIISAVISIRKVMRLEPAIVFKG